MAPVLEAAIVKGKPEEYEERNVHAVYNAIAPHFSSTRYKVSNDLPLSLHFNICQNSHGQLSLIFYRVCRQGGLV